MFVHNKFQGSVLFGKLALFTLELNELASQGILLNAKGIPLAFQFLHLLSVLS